jgi:hypothetical protein
MKLPTNVFLRAIKDDTNFMAHNKIMLNVLLYCLQFENKTPLTHKHKTSGRVNLPITILREH